MATITSLPVASTIDAVADTFPIVTNSINTTQQISRNTFLSLSSAPVGLTDAQTLTSKTLTNPTINSATLSGTISGTYTLGGTPTFPSTVVTTTGTQTLTSKTLTSPTINSPTITNATISADTLTGYTTSNTGTVYGIPITTGVINTAGTINGASLVSASVGSAALATNAVQGNQLATSAITLGYTQTTADFSSASTTAVQVTGLTTTVTIPSGSRKIKVTAFSSYMYAGTAAAAAYISIWDGTVGSGTQLQESQVTSATGGQGYVGIAIAVVTPAAGSKTYNIGYRVSSGAAGTFHGSATTPAFILVEAI